MTPPIRPRTILAPFALTAAVTLAILLATYAAAAADDGPPSLASESGFIAWWRSGALTAPLIVVVALVLVGLEKLSTTRWPGLSWLRRGSVRGYLSVTLAAVGGLLPAVASGTATLGGLSVALLGGLMFVNKGGGETKAEQAQEPPT